MFDIAYLRQRLRYDPETGKLFWLYYDGHPQRWNTRYAGREALISKHESGCLEGRIDNRHVKAHRAAWALHYGVWPDREIDHENHDASDNRIGNLRLAGKVGNMRNLPRSRANTSGATGVVWYKRKAKWHARIKAAGRQYSLGYYDRFEDAVAARKRAERDHGFHPNHGKARAT
jgi:hypothetical protein